MSTVDVRVRTIDTEESERKVLALASCESMRIFDTATEI